MRYTVNEFIEGSLVREEGEQLFELVRDRVL